MSDKRLKAQFVRHEAALRDLWNAFDLIGVMDDPQWPRDEYDRYLATTLRLLKDGAGTLAIADYVNRVVRDDIGLPGNPNAAYTFACQLEAWFQTDAAGQDSEMPKPN